MHHVTRSTYLMTYDIASAFRTEVHRVFLASPTCRRRTCYRRATFCALNEVTKWPFILGPAYALRTLLVEKEL